MIPVCPSYTIWERNFWQLLIFLELEPYCTILCSPRHWIWLRETGISSSWKMSTHKNKERLYGTSMSILYNVGKSYVTYTYIYVDRAILHSPWVPDFPSFALFLSFPPANACPFTPLKWSGYIILMTTSALLYSSKLWWSFGAPAIWQEGLPIFERLLLE